MKDCSKEIIKFHNEEVTLPEAQQSEMRRRRNANRKRLKDGLANQEKPKPIGCNSQGSYSMKTMVQDSQKDFDIDDGVYFYKEDLVGRNGAEMSSLQVRKMVCEALSAGNNFARPPEVLKNCVRVYYTEGHHVDVPAYRKIENYNQLFGTTSSEYQLAGADWRSSDPLSVTDWFKSTNKAKSPDPGTNGGQFRRIVRLLKKFARSRNSWKRSIASGFMITKLAEEEFVADLGRDDRALRDIMRRINIRLKNSTFLSHPVLSAEKLAEEGDARLTFFQSRLEENLEHLAILGDQNCAHQSAMSAWDKVFNCSWFSDQPEPRRTKGDSAIFGTPTSAVKKKGGGPFA